MFTMPVEGDGGKGVDIHVTICRHQYLLVKSSVKRIVFDYSEISEDISYRNDYNTTMWVLFGFCDVGRWRTILSI